MYCLCPMWLARVITLVLVLRHSNENHSSVQNLPFLVLQPRGKAAILGVNTTEFFLDEGFTWNWSLVPRGKKCFYSWPPTWPPWRHVRTSNMASLRVGSVFAYISIRDSLQPVIFVILYNANLRVYYTASISFTLGWGVNRPFPSFSKRLVQCKTKRESVDMKRISYSHANKTRFHRNSLDLASFCKWGLLEFS